MTVGALQVKQPVSLSFWEKGVYHGHKITRQAGQDTSANLSKFHVCCQNQHHCDYRNAGDYGGNANLALNLPYRHLSRT